MAQAAFNGFREVKVKVRRSEFDDVTIKSVDREGTRLCHTLKRYDRACKVVKRELEYDQRQTVKLSRKIRAADLFHMLSLNGDNPSRDKAHPHPSKETGSTESPRPSTVSRKHKQRAMTANPTSRISNEGGSTLPQYKVLEKNIPRQSLNDSSDDSINDYSSVPCHRPSTGRQNRKTLFDSLSQPKNRSDVLSVRQRLRQEFGKQRPQTSHPPSSQNRHGASRVVIQGTGKNAVAMITTRSPQRTKTLSHQRPTPRDVPDGEQKLSQEQLHILLCSPMPVIVKRHEDDV